MRKVELSAVTTGNKTIQTMASSYIIKKKKKAISRILETVVTFHFSGGKVYSMNKGCHTCMIKHTMQVQSLHCSAYLTWLDVCIYVPRSHFHFLKRLLGKGQLRIA